MPDRTTATPEAQTDQPGDASPSQSGGVVMRGALRGKDFASQVQMLEPRGDNDKKSPPGNPAPTTIPVVFEGHTDETKMKPDTARDLGIIKDKIYSVPVNLSTLADIGSSKQFPAWVVPTGKDVPVAGEDLFEHDKGGIPGGSGSTSFILRDNGQTRDSFTVTAGNNGMLALMRSARAANGGLTPYGMTQANHFARPADKAFEALCAYKMNNKKEAPDARNQNFYGGIAMNELKAKAANTFNQIAGSFMAAWNLSGRIHTSQPYDDFWTPLDGDVANAAIKLEGVLSGAWVDRDPTSRVTYVKGPLALQAAFKDAVAAKADNDKKLGTNAPRFPATLIQPFIDTFVGQLTSTLDLSFIPADQKDFKDRFTTSWQKAITDLFASAATDVENAYFFLQKDVSTVKGQSLTTDPNQNEQTNDPGKVH